MSGRSTSRTGVTAASPAPRSRRPSNCASLARPAGDCVDCRQCINVCPTGVDIRDGIQLGCIQCGLCIDACDAVMQQVNRPTGLIAYDTDINAERRLAGQPPSLPPDPATHHSLCRDHRGGRQHHAVHIGDPRLDGHQRVARTQPPVRHLERWQRPQRLYRALSQQGRRVALVRAGGARSSRRRYSRRGDRPRRGQQAHCRSRPDQTREIRVSLQVPAAKLPKQAADIDFKATEIATGETASVRDHFVPAAR